MIRGPTPVTFWLVFGLAVIWVIFGILSIWRGYLYGLGFLITGIAITVVAVYLLRTVANPNGAQ